MTGKGKERGWEEDGTKQEGQRVEKKKKEEMMIQLFLTCGQFILSNAAKIFQHFSFPNVT